MASHIGVGIPVCSRTWRSRSLKHLNRDIGDLGTEAPDEMIVECADSAEAAVRSSDQMVFNGMHADIPVLIAPQSMTGGEVRQAATPLRSLSDPARMDPIWLTGLI